MRKIEQRNISPARRIAVSAVPTDARDLHGILIQLEQVRLMGVRRAVWTRESDVDRLVDRDRSVQQRAEEAPVAAIACGVVARVDDRLRERVRGHP